MKLVSYLDEERDHLGVLVDGIVYGMEIFDKDIPANMEMFLELWDECFPIVKKGLSKIDNGELTSEYGTPIEALHLLAPVPFPNSCRDSYAFRQHVEAARRNRKLDM